MFSLMLAEYGEPGSAPVLAALAAGRHAAVHYACTQGMAATAARVAAAYGPPGCAALREALSETRIFPGVFYAMSDEGPEYCASQPGGLAARKVFYNGTLAAMLIALGEPDSATAVQKVGVWLEELCDCLGKEPEERRARTPAARLARIPPDSLLARLAVAAPAAWALNPDAASALLSAPLRSSLALPRLLALRRLPAGVAAPVAAHLRARRWLLFAGAADAEMQVG